MMPRSRGARQARAQLDFGLTTVARPNPAVVAWRWRYELLGVASLAVAWTTLGTATAAAAAVALVASLALTATFPAGRQFLLERAWCIVTPHRLRSGCAQAWIHSRDGKIPAVILTRPYPFGERVYLWCWAGISAEDLSLSRRLLAAACWADDIRVCRHPSYAQLVVVDVIRHRHLDTAERPEQVIGTGGTGGAGSLWPSPPFDVGQG